MRALLIESDNALSRDIASILRGAGTNAFAVDAVGDVVELARRYIYDVIILDLQVLGALETLGALRQASVTTPVVALSARDATGAKVRALQLGADVCIDTPFHKDEFLAQVQAIVRRAGAYMRSAVRAEKIAADLDARTVEVDGYRVPVTPREYAILELLMLRKGTVVTDAMLLNHLYGDGRQPEQSAIGGFVRTLRRKLASAGAVDAIWTVKGRGYLIPVPDDPRFAAAKGAAGNAQPGP